MKIIEPAAAPVPNGRSCRNVSTKRYAGTARTGCGRLENIAQNTPHHAASHA
jgi:hypothetical protein